MAPASGAGSIYLKRADAAFGDLLVDNGGQTATPTELPALGIADIAAVSGNTLTLSQKYAAPSLAGRWVRLFAPDGTVRGTTRIASVQNGPSVRTLNDFTAIFTQDAVAYSGYLAYSDAGVAINGETRHFVALRDNGGQWQLDNDAAFVPYAPAAGDRHLHEGREGDPHLRQADLLRPLRRDRRHHGRRADRPAHSEHHRAALAARVA